MTAVQESTEPLSTIELQNVVASSGSIGNLISSASRPISTGRSTILIELLDCSIEPPSPKLLHSCFARGKLVATGASSIENARTAIGRVLAELATLDIPVPDEPEITVQNIVASADLGQRLNLNAIAIGLGLEHVEYEPEQFPGLVYRLDEPSVVVLLFGSGKTVITGGK